MVSTADALAVASFSLVRSVCRLSTKVSKVWLIAESPAETMSNTSWKKMSSFSNGAYEFVVIDLWRSLIILVTFRTKRWRNAFGFVALCRTYVNKNWFTWAWRIESICVKFSTWQPIRGWKCQKHTDEMKRQILKVSRWHIAYLWNIKSHILGVRKESCAKFWLPNENFPSQNLTTERTFRVKKVKSTKSTEAEFCWLSTQ